MANILPLPLGEGRGEGLLFPLLGLFFAVFCLLSSVLCLLFLLTGCRTPPPRTTPLPPRPLLAAITHLPHLELRSAIPEGPQATSGQLLRDPANGGYIFLITWIRLWPGHSYMQQYSIDGQSWRDGPHFLATNTEQIIRREIPPLPPGAPNRIFLRLRDLSLSLALRENRKAKI